MSVVRPDDRWIATRVVGGAPRCNRVFKVNGKAARLRDTWILEDADGAEVARIEEKVLSVRDKITIGLGGVT
jgi:uncharacterized protein YxjI